MSYCRQDGKDRVVFVTKEDHEAPSKITLSVSADDEPRGLILPNGEINWSCPCLGGMATGPCGVQFREAFSCFHYSKAEPKGSDCLEHFEAMQRCMSQYPTLYPRRESTEDDDDDEDEDLDNIKEVSSTITETRSSSTTAIANESKSKSE